MGAGTGRSLLSALFSLFQTRVRRDKNEQEDYAAFLRMTEPDEAELARERAYAPPHPVRFAVCILGGGESQAAQTAASLEAQTYRFFEFARDPALARGDFVLLLRAGDALAPDALYHFALRIGEKSGAKILYADEDALLAGRRAQPVFKPDFSEMTALSYDLLGTPVAIAQALCKACWEPQMGETFTPAQSYAFLLRCLAKAGHAEHIARVLATRGALPEPPESVAASEAIERYLRATGQKADVSAGLWPGSFHVWAKGGGRETTAVIIPNLNGENELRRLLESIEETSSLYEPRIVIADGGSTSQRTLRYYDILEKNKAAHILTLEGAGFARLCNAAAKDACAKNLLFLARDAELLTPDLIGELGAQARRRNAGAVGCTLVDETGRLVHTGFAAGLCGALESPYAGEEQGGGSLRKLHFTKTLRAVSAVSGACLCVRADAFFGAGGFDEAFDQPGEVMPCGADAAFCLRLIAMGRTNIFTPFARAALHVRLPRVEEAGEAVRLRTLEALAPLSAAGDPYFSGNFSARSRVPVARGEEL